MPDTNLNVLQPIRFEAGGILRLTDGATTYILRNRQKGSLRIKWAGYEPLPWQELGLNQVPLEGDQTVPGFEVTVKLSKPDTTSLMSLVSKRNTSSSQGLTYVFTPTQIDILDARGVATGTRITLTNAYFVPGSVEISAGTDFDTVKLAMDGTSIAAATF